MEKYKNGSTSTMYISKSSHKCYADGSFKRYASDGFICIFIIAGIIFVWIIMELSLIFPNLVHIGYIGKSKKQHIPEIVLEEITK